MSRLRRHRNWILTAMALSSLAALIISVLLPMVYRGRDLRPGIGIEN